MPEGEGKIIHTEDLFANKAKYDQLAKLLPDGVFPPFERKGGIIPIGSLDEITTALLQDAISKVHAKLADGDQSFRIIEFYTVHKPWLISMLQMSLYVAQKDKGAEYQHAKLSIGGTVYAPTMINGITPTRLITEGAKLVDDDPDSVGKCYLEKTDDFQENQIVWRILFPSHNTITFNEFRASYDKYLRQLKVDTTDPDLQMAYKNSYNGPMDLRVNIIRTRNKSDFTDIYSTEKLKTQSDIGDQILPALVSCNQILGYMTEDLARAYNMTTPGKTAGFVGAIPENDNAFERYKLMKESIKLE